MDVKIRIDLQAPMFIIGNTQVDIDEIPIENIEVLALACTSLIDNKIDVRLYEEDGKIKISKISYGNTSIKEQDISKSLGDAILNNVRGNHG